MRAGFRAQSSRFIVDSALEFIEKHRERPFYTQLWMLLPHAPLNPTEEQLEPYKRFAPTADIPHKGTAQIYFASLGDLDTQIGRLIARLDEMGLSENTLILLSSDNGPEDIHIANASHSAMGSPGPFRGRKRSLYEGGVRVPFLARWRGRVPAGRVEDRAVLSAVDFLPTFTAMAGVKAPADQDGENVGDILLGASRARTRPLLWEWRFNIAGYNVNRSPMLSIRDGDWKLLMNPDRSRVELYRIPEDPMELNNLAGAKPDVVKRLSEQVLAWRKTLPPGPVEPMAGKNDYPFPRPN
jgi:N-acetylgalactosamine-6-sulfatase